VLAADYHKHDDEVRRYSTRRPGGGGRTVEEADIVAADVSSIKKNDLGALVAGGLVFILSLMPAWITYSFDGPGSDAFGGLDSGINAWHSYNVLALLLLLLATTVVAVKVFAPQALPSSLPVGTGVIAAGLAVVGTLLMLLRTLTLFNSESSGGVELSQGPGWSGWLLMIAAVALTAFTAMGFQDSGEPLPWQNAAHTGAGAYGGSTTAGQPAPPTGPPSAPPAGPPAAPPAPSSPTTPPGGQQAPPPAGPPPGQQPPPGHPADGGTAPRPPV